MAAPTADRNLNPRSNPYAPWYHLDLPLIVAALGLSALGIAVIYSATRGPDPDSFTTFYLQRQSLFVVAGIALMAVLAAIPYANLRQFAWAFYGVGLLGLLAVLAVGEEVNGARAWFNIGSFGIQPSEFLKLGLIILLASYLAQFEGRLELGRLVTVLALAAVPMALILLQPDVGTVLVYVVIVMGMLLVGGVRLRHILVLSVIGAIGVGVIVNSPLLEDYQRDRLLTFVNPDEAADGDATAAAYNQEQAQIAIGHGGLSGQGYGQGTQTRTGLVPEQETDFIFTVVGEELGFIGSAILLGGFAVLAWRTWRTAQVAKDMFGSLICVGVMTMLVFQMFQSVGMTVGIMPITGIPLPFVSYGGSSALTSFAALGLVLSVRMRRFI